MLPAFQELRDFVHGEYSNNLRHGPGIIDSCHDGKELYQAFIDYHTTAEGMTPESLFKYGQEQLELSTERFVELAEIIYSSRRKSKMTFEDAVKAVVEDKKSLFRNKEETLDAFIDEVENINPRLKDLFEDHLLDNDVYEVNVKPVPPNGGGIAYYITPSLDGRRKGK